MMDSFDNPFVSYSQSTLPDIWAKGPYYKLRPGEAQEQDFIRPQFLNENKVWWVPVSATSFVQISNLACFPPDWIQAFVTLFY